MDEDADKNNLGIDKYNTNKDIEDLTGLHHVNNRTNIVSTNSTNPNISNRINPNPVTENGLILLEPNAAVGKEIT
jgi:hypothetical protein